MHGNRMKCFLFVFIYILLIWTPAVVTGNPACNGPSLPMLPPWASFGVTQPHTTSSTNDFSNFLFCFFCCFFIIIVAWFHRLKEKKKRKQKKCDNLTYALATTSESVFANNCTGIMPSNAAPFLPLANGVRQHSTM